MKKIFFVAILWLSCSLYALPIGNPTEATLFFPQKKECTPPSFWNNFHAGFGFYGDYVFKSDMETDTARKKAIDFTQLFTNAGYCVVNFCNRIDLFATFGTTALSLNTSLGAFNIPDPHPKFELITLSSFSSSIGARSTLYRWNRFALGVMGQYFSTHPPIKRLYIASGAVSYPDNVLKTHYREWQVAMGISYRYNPFFVPYVALKYSRARWRIDDGRLFIIENNMTTHLYNLKSRRPWGWGVGLTFYPPACERGAVTVEGRFINEKAFYVLGEMRF
jgi:hypothetical protein